MNWEAAATVAEIVGAIAVVVSVIYLAIQVRGNTREAMEAAISSAIDAFNNFDRMIATDADLASILMRGEKSNASLSPVEQRQFDSLMSIEFTVYERWHTDSRRTGLGQEHDDLMMFMLGQRLAEGGVSQWWDKNREWFPPSFIAWVDSLQTQPS